MGPGNTLGRKTPEGSIRMSQSPKLPAKAEAKTSSHRPKLMPNASSALAVCSQQQQMRSPKLTTSKLDANMLCDMCLSTGSHCRMPDVVKRDLV